MTTTWKNLTCEEEIDRVQHERPNLQLFRKIAQGIYLLLSDSDLAFSQMLEHTRPRPGSAFRFLTT